MDERAKCEKWQALESQLAQLAWDEETTGADFGEAEAVLEQERQALLATLVPGVGVEGERLRRQQTLAAAVPARLLEALTLAQSRAMRAWAAARIANDFEVLSPALAALVPLVRERGAALAAALDIDSPYDALLDENDPGLRHADARSLVSELAQAPAPPAKDPRKFHLPRDQQIALCDSLLARIGFDATRGRRGEAAHPFTIVCGEDDIRLAVRFDEQRLATAVLTTMHEAGHALFDQRLTRVHRRSFLSQCPSASLHEAHARLYENIIGRSAGFWRGQRDLMAQYAPELELDAWVSNLAAGHPGPLRLRADSVRYHRHIALRCELEAALITGSLRVENLAEAWRDASVRHLKVAPAHDNEGCLQDNHWPCGMFGYFATYSVGEAIACQLAEAMQVETLLAQPRAVNAWLAAHLPSDTATAAEAILAATGAPLSAAPFLRRYTDK